MERKGDRSAGSSLGVQSRYAAAGPSTGAHHRARLTRVHLIPFLERQQAVQRVSCQPPVCRGQTNLTATWGIVQWDISTVRLLAAARRIADGGGSSSLDPLVRALRLHSDRPDVVGNGDTELPHVACPGRGSHVGSREHVVHVEPEGVEHLLAA